MDDVIAGLCLVRPVRRRKTLLREFGAEWGVEPTILTALGIPSRKQVFTKSPFYHWEALFILSLIRLCMFQERKKVLKVSKSTVLIK